VCSALGVQFQNAFSFCDFASRIDLGVHVLQIKYKTSQL
jgi:hypothetical protein